LLRRIFVLKKDEITGGWEQVHNEELHNFHSSPNIVSMIKQRMTRWTRRVARMGEKMNAYKVLVEKPEGKSPLGGLRHR
jgi:hypothetical protein